MNNTIRYKWRIVLRNDRLTTSESYLKNRIVLISNAKNKSSDPLMMSHTCHIRNRITTKYSRIPTLGKNEIISTYIPEKN